jgi:cell shape-determining protein MreC
MKPINLMEESDIRERLQEINDKKIIAYKEVETLRSEEMRLLKLLETIKGK